MNLLNNIDKLFNDEENFIIDDLIKNIKEEDEKKQEDKKEEEKKQEDKKEEKKQEDKKEEKQQETNQEETLGDDSETEGDEETDFDAGDDDFSVEDNLSLDDLGKVYQLKDIFNEILNLYDICFKLLLFDNKIKYVLILIKKLIDNYKFIINNIDQFKDKLNDIINQYRRIIINLYKYINIKVKEISIKVENE